MQEMCLHQAHVFAKCVCVAIFGRKGRESVWACKKPTFWELFGGAFLKRGVGSTPAHKLHTSGGAHQEILVYHVSSKEGVFKLKELKKFNRITFTKGV